MRKRSLPPLPPPTPKLTRRAALAGAAGAILTPTAALGAASDRGRTWARRVGRVSGQSKEIEAGRRFALAGVQWSGPATARIEVRTRRRGGRWSPWALASVQGHEPDNRPSPSARFGEPLWFGSADLIQLRSARSVDGVRLHFVARADRWYSRALPAPGASRAGTAALELAAPILAAGPGQPEIIARSVWAGRDAPPAGPPNYGAVRLAFVHHTDNPNGYGPGDVPALLLAIFDFHRHVRGYRDIAYNFIIDAFGRVWEARAGGIDKPVLGAHAGGFNAVSTGIAVLGTFVSSVPPPSALDALQRLLAWKLSLHGLPALGEVGVRVSPAGASYTPFRPAQLVELERISGHRDGDLTDCPGDALYARLPALRPVVAGLAPAPARLTLTASSRAVAPGAAVTLVGTLATLSGGVPLAEATVEVQRIDGGAETTIATAVTDAAGAWSWPLTTERNVLVRALHRAAPACVSGLVAIGVAPRLTLAVEAGSPRRVRGTIVPPKAGVTLDTYQLIGGRRRLLRSRRIRVRDGRFGAPVPLGAAAHRRGRRLVVVARTVEGGGTLAGQSPPVVVKL